MELSQAHHASNRKRIVFLAGLPRTGSTAIAALFNQNPAIHTGGTSPLINLLYGARQVCRTTAKEALQRRRNEGFEHEWLHDLPQLYYRKVAAPIIIDKNRGWNRDPEFLRFYVTPSPRIVVLLRPITEIVKSFIRVRLEQKMELPERNLLDDQDGLMLNIRDVAWCLSNQSDDYFFVTYEQFVTQPRQVINEIASFWQLPEAKYDLKNVIDESPDNDFASFQVGLHVVKPSVEKADYKVPVSNRLWSKAKELDAALWHDYEQAKKMNMARFCQA